MGNSVSLVTRETLPGVCGYPVWTNDLSEGPGGWVHPVNTCRTIYSQ